MRSRLVGFVFLGLGLGLSAASVCAQDAAASYKLTTGVYALTGVGSPSHGLDVNLRRTSENGDLWLAWYRSAEQNVSQPRVGWDSTYQASAWRVMPSVQAASSGFWGGSLSVETGETWFAGVGLGRTNLRPYTNLNFDPNDAWMASAGYRWSSVQSLSFQVVRDNRENPDQQHVHALYRTGLSHGQRLTVDMLFKSGLVNDQFTRRTGLSVTYDWPQFFTRVAYDPIINFTLQTMWRVSVGTRF
jgi:hypothetical protein